MRPRAESQGQLVGIRRLQPHFWTISLTEADSCFFREIDTPDCARWAPRPQVDNAMVKALARAFRWRGMLDDGVCGTIEELAKRERVNHGYMSRVLCLTLLAPDTVEAILDGRQAEGLPLEDQLEGFPAEWDRHATFGDDLSPSKARILLMLGMAETTDRDALKSYSDR